MPKEVASPRAGRVVTLLLHLGAVRDWDWGFPALPSSMLRRKLQLILIFPNLHILSARDTEPAQARSGLLAEAQLCQTPLDIFQGQLGSGGSTAPHMEQWPRNLTGQSQLC